MLEPHILVFLIYLSILTNFVHAETCTESSDTKEVVLRCPANKLEWEKAARKKNCSAIHGIENCKGVEYHCLVNTLRDEVVEVCSTPRLLQGYCPIYTSLNTSIKGNIKSPRNDYERPCMDLPPPSNCATLYRSTDAYKWQNCYDVVYKITKDNTETTRPIQTRDKNRSQESSNDLTALWIILALLGLVLVIYILFVVYNVKVKKRAWRKALCLCGECPFTCLDNLSCCLDDGKMGTPEEKRAMIHGETPAVTPNEDNVGTNLAQNGENIEIHDVDGREDDREEANVLKTTSDAADGNNSGTLVTEGPIQSTDVSQPPYVLFGSSNQSANPSLENEDQPVVALDERVIQLGGKFEDLLRRMNNVAEDPFKDLEFRITSVVSRIEIFFGKPYRTGPLNKQFADLKQKVCEVDSKLKNFHSKLDEIGLDFIDDDRLNKQTGDWEKQMNKSANAQRKDDGLDAINTKDNFHKCTGDGMKGMSKPPTSKTNDEKNSETLQNDDDNKADNMIEKRLDDDPDDSHESDRQLQGFKPKIELKKKRQKDRLVEDEANVPLSLNKGEENYSEEEQGEIKKKTIRLDDEVVDLMIEYEKYKEEKGKCGNLEKLQRAVWTMEADLTALSEIYDDESESSRVNHIKEKIEQIGQRLQDAKENFSKKKEMHSW